MYSLFRQYIPETNTIGANVEGEQQVPQGAPSDIQSDEEYVPLSKKRMATTTPNVGPSKKKCNERRVSEKENIWDVSIKVARNYARQNNIQSANRMYNKQDSKMI